MYRRTARQSVSVWMALLSVLIVLMKAVAAAAIRVTLAGWRAAVGAPNALRGAASRPIHTGADRAAGSAFRSAGRAPASRGHGVTLAACTSADRPGQKRCVCLSLLVTCADDPGGPCVCRLVRGPLQRAAPFRLVLGQCPESARQRQCARTLNALCAHCEAAPWLVSRADGRSVTRDVAEQPIRHATSSHSPCMNSHRGQAYGR